MGEPLAVGERGETRWAGGRDADSGAVRGDADRDRRSRGGDPPVTPSCEQVLRLALALAGREEVASAGVGAFGAADAERSATANRFQLAIDHQAVAIVAPQHADFPDTVVVTVRAIAAVEDCTDERAAEEAIAPTAAEHQR